MILAADLGSTNFKTAIFAPNGKRIGEASQPVPYEIHTNTRAELSPRAMVETFDEASARALQAAGVSGRDVQRVSLTSQAQTFCICDSEGMAKGAFTGWSDQRAVEEAAQLQAVLGPNYHTTTGWPHPAPGQLAAQALWSTRHTRPSSSSRFVTLPSYLAMCLGAPFVIDRNLAAMTGLYSIPGGDWWPEALSAACIKKAQLAAVVNTGQPVPTGGTVARQLSCGLAPLDVVFGGNDHTAAAVGCGCSPQRAVLTIGTAGVFYHRHPSREVGPFSPAGTWGPYPTDGFYEMQFISHACSALDWADKTLFGRIDTPRFVAAAQHAGAAGEVRFDPNRWGSTSAWSGHGTKEQKALAVLQGIASALRGLAPKELDPGQEIIVMGGGSRLDLWVQMLANLFGCPLMRMDTDGLSGAAMMAGWVPKEHKMTEMFLPLGNAPITQVSR